MRSSPSSSSTHKHRNPSNCTQTCPVPAFSSSLQSRVFGGHHRSIELVFFFLFSCFAFLLLSFFFFFFFSFASQRNRPKLMMTVMVMMMKLVERDKRPCPPTRAPPAPLLPQALLFVSISLSVLTCATYRARARVHAYACVCLCGMRIVLQNERKIWTFADPFFFSFENQNFSIKTISS